MCTNRGKDYTFELKRGFYLLLQTQNGDTLLGLGWENESQKGRTWDDAASLERCKRLINIIMALP